MADKLTFILPSVVTVLYVATSVAFIAKRQYPLALVWGAYALANIGLIWSSYSSS